MNLTPLQQAAIAYSLHIAFRAPKPSTLQMTLLLQHERGETLGEVAMDILKDIV